MAMFGLPIATLCYGRYTYSVLEQVAGSVQAGTLASVNIARQAALRGWYHSERYASREPPAAAVRLGSKFSATSFTPTPALGGVNRNSLPLRLRSCCLNPSLPSSLQTKA
ncbi:MAG: hypothetical protein FRX49_08473 [Trebouxia sp. A1-2]|nr:MAG: hypothetical protein FRX49_08473 [Trebouxia sp. A1-2]